MDDLAVVLLAHADAAQVRRLLASLEPLPVFLHCDAKTPATVFDAMVARLPEHVRTTPRVRTSLSSWSLVEAELVALREALWHSDARHIAVLSGADYPLVPVTEIVAELASWGDESYFWNVPMPFPSWDTPRNPDGGLWRLRRRFLTFRGQVLYVRGIPLRWPFPRRIPPELQLRASSQWKIYSRRHAEALLEVVDSRPDLVRFWQHTLVPDEMFAATVLASEALVGSGNVLARCTAHAWYMDWPEGEGVYHPRWLENRDFEALANASQGRHVTPAEARPTEVQGQRRLFGRKFSSDRSSALLDRVDVELLGRRGSDRPG